MSFVMAAILSITLQCLTAKHGMSRPHDETSGLFPWPGNFILHWLFLFSPRIHTCLWAPMHRYCRIPSKILTLLKLCHHIKKKKFLKEFWSSLQIFQTNKPKTKPKQNNKHQESSPSFIRKSDIYIYHFEGKITDISTPGEQNRLKLVFFSFSCTSFYVITKLGYIQKMPCIYSHSFILLCLLEILNGVYFFWNAEERWKRQKQKWKDTSLSFSRNALTREKVMKYQNTTSCPLCICLSSRKLHKYICHILSKGWKAQWISYIFVSWSDSNLTKNNQLIIFTFS